MKLKRLFFTTANVSLTAQDYAVLDVYRSLGDHPACAADVFLKLAAELGKQPRVATVYKVVTKLVKLGMLTDVGEAPPTGGRPRRMYRLTPTGHRALDLAEELVQASGGLASLVPA